MPDEVPDEVTLLENADDSAVGADVSGSKRRLSLLEPKVGFRK